MKIRTHSKGRITVSCGLSKHLPNAKRANWARLKAEAERREADRVAAATPAVTA